MLGLGSNIIKSPTSGVTIVTDNLVLNHGYALNPVQPLSDGAAYFSGNNEKITITEVVLDTLGSCAITFWYKHHGGGATAWAVLGHTSEGNAQHIRFYGGELILEDDGNNRARVTPTNYLDSNWHHYAISVSSNTVSIYQDGVSLAVSSSTAGADTTINTIGGQDTSGNSYNLAGYLCNLGIWSRAITQAEIKSVMWKQYSDLTSSETTSLVSWWNLSADANDNHGSNNGTLA